MKKIKPPRLFDAGDVAAVFIGIIFFALAMLLPLPSWARGVLVVIALLFTFPFW